MVYHLLKIWNLPKFGFFSLFFQLRNRVSSSHQADTLRTDARNTGLFGTIIDWGRKVGTSVQKGIARTKFLSEILPKKFFLGEIPNTHFCTHGAQPIRNPQP